jgi:hypothetical protein
MPRRSRLGPRTRRLVRPTRPPSFSHLARAFLASPSRSCRPPASAPQRISTSPARQRAIHSSRRSPRSRPPLPRSRMDDRTNDRPIPHRVALAQQACARTPPPRPSPPPLLRLLMFLLLVICFYVVIPNRVFCGRFEGSAVDLLLLPSLLMAQACPPCRVLQPWHVASALRFCIVIPNRVFCGCPILCGLCKGWVFFEFFFRTWSSRARPVFSRRGTCCYL